MVRHSRPLFLITVRTALIDQLSAIVFCFNYEEVRK
jgi:hypothetical protein